MPPSFGNSGQGDTYWYHGSGSAVANPFSIGNGQYLSITATHLDTPIAEGDGTFAHWGSGQLRGNALEYGYIEFNAKVPTTQGFWPALWLANGQGTQTAGVEIDNPEYFGTNTAVDTFWESYSPSIRTTGSSTIVPTAMSAFHTYGLLWSSSGIVAYIDRVPVTSNFTAYGYKSPMRPVITMGVFASNTFAPPPQNNNQATMYVTYYRAWQATANSCSPSTLPTPLP